MAASRIWRRLSAAAPTRGVGARMGRPQPRRVSWLRSSAAGLLGPHVGGTLAVRQARQLVAHFGLAGEGELGAAIARAVVGHARQDLTPRIDDHRVAVALLVLGVHPDLSGGDHEDLVLDRTGADEDLPVRLTGDLREGGRQRDDGGPADGEDAKELGKPKVVTDGQAERLAVAELRQDDLVTGLLGGRLLVFDVADDDVEHVDLPVDGVDVAVRRDVNAVVGEFPAPLAPFDDRAGDEIYSEFPGGLPRPRERRPV